MHNGNCVKYVDVELSCSKNSNLHESPNSDFTPKGWEMNHNITLSLNKSIPVSFDATLFYDADNGTTTHESTNVTFSANSTSATVSLQSHNDGCHSLWLNTTAWHNFLSNWSWSAGEVQVWNTIYRISSKGNGCTDDDFNSADAQYCSVTKTNWSCKLNWRYDCWAWNSINNKFLNYVYTWDCQGINGWTTDNCSVDCHIYCTQGTTYACHTNDGFYTNGSNQKTNRDYSTKKWTFEWDCWTPSPCDGVSSPSSLHCTCVTKSCMDYWYQDAYWETPAQLTAQGMEGVEITEDNCWMSLSCKKPIPILYVYLAPDICVWDGGKCGLWFNTMEGDWTTWTVQKTSWTVNLSYCIQWEGTTWLPKCSNDYACTLNGINLSSSDGSQVWSNWWRFSDWSTVTVNVSPSWSCY